MMLMIHTLLLFLFSMSVVSSASVDRIVLQPREKEIFPREVDVALNTKTGQTLVVWERRVYNKREHSIWGHLLQPDGKPIGNAFEIISGPNARVPSLAYNSDRNEFLLAYANELVEPTRPEIDAVRLTATARCKSKPIRISDPADLAKDMENWAPAAIYDAETKGYIVLWWRVDHGPSTKLDGIFGSVLNGDLTSRRAHVFIEPVSKKPDIVLGPYFEDVAIHSPTGQLLIAQTIMEGSIHSGFQQKFQLARIDKTLQNPQATISTLNTGLTDSWGIDLMLLPNGQMASLFNMPDGVRRRSISSLGVPVGGAKRFFARPISNMNLSVRSALAGVNGSSEVAVFGYQGSRTQSGNIWMQLTDWKGKAVGHALQVQSGFNSVHPPVVQALPATSTRGHWYAVIYVEGPLDNPALEPNQSSEIILLRVNSAP